MQSRVVCSAIAPLTVLAEPRVHQLKALRGAQCSDHVLVLGGKYRGYIEATRCVKACPERQVGAQTRGEL